MVYGLKIYLRDILLGDLLTQKYPAFKLGIYIYVVWLVLEILNAYITIGIYNQANEYVVYHSSSTI